MDKSQIRELFNATRPFPDSDPQRHLEFGYLEYPRSLIVEYARNVLPFENFTIEISPFTLNGKHPELFGYCNWYEKNELLQIFYRVQPERFMERIIIAEALGSIVLGFIPEQLEMTDFASDNNQIVYFAQKLLEFSASSNKGSILRKQYTLSSADIANEIRKLHAGYDAKSLSISQKTRIDSLFNKIFSCGVSQDNVQGMLSSNIKLITKYIQSKEPTTADGLQNKLSIEISPSDNAKLIIGMLFCHKEGCDIWYPPISQIRASRRLANLPEIDELSVIRLIIAHELGHVVCHRIPQYVGPIGGTKPSTSKEEREATYFARLLLEHRELLYNNMNEDEKYNNACQEIRKLIQQVYKSRGDEWLNWVLSD